MKIGITVDIRHSMFSAGHPNSCIAIAEAFQVGGHEVIFIKREHERTWWDDVKDLEADASIQHIDSVFELDLLIEVGFLATPLERARYNKCVWYCRKPALFSDIEATVFACRTEGRDLQGISEIWVADIFNNNDDIVYLKNLYGFASIRLVPWLWSSTIVEAHRKQMQSPVWKQVKDLIPETKWSLHVSESNFSNTSSCTIPIVVLKDVMLKTKIEKIHIHNTEHLIDSKYFKMNILDNCEVEGIKLIGKQRVIDWSHEPMSIVLAHSRFIPLKLANLEAAWVGLPLIHNNTILRDFGCGLEDTFYENNNIGGALYALKNTLSSHHTIPYLSNLDSLTELRTKILYRFSPEARAKEWLALLSNPVAPVKTIQPSVNRAISVKRTYRILFTDMWDQFSPAYNMFILAFKHAMPEVEVLGYRIETLQKGIKHDIHIFGPFGDAWKKIEGPKVHFTGENTEPIQEASVKLNMGFKYINSPSYFRLPLWMIYINWFNAEDANEITNPLTIPVESCTTVPIVETPRSKFCAFIVSNPKNDIRNAAFKALNEYKPVDSAGRLFNNVGDKLFAGLGGGGGELKKHEFLKDYKFCLCYENESSDGYVTEKLLHAKAAGCIPIYWGDPQVSKDFNEEGFINLTGSPESLVQRVKEIDESEELYNKIRSVPAIGHERVSTLKGKFTEMVDHILSGYLVVTFATEKFWPSLVRWLDAVKHHVSSMNDIKVRVYVGHDVKEQVIEKTIEKYKFATFIRIPNETPAGFDDFWKPEHYAWKLWILNDLSQDPTLKGNLVLYSDCGSILIRWPTEWLNEARKHKICFIEDSSNINKTWCHARFCSRLEVSEMELHSNQLWAGAIAFICGDSTVTRLFKESYDLGCIREVIVGEKWTFDPRKIKDGVLTHDGSISLGHRHDQSILSILSFRYKSKRYPIDKIVNYDSARSTYFSGKSIYLHRGDYKTHIPIMQGIDEAYVVNLDRRVDRKTSFVEHHPYFKGVVKRHMGCDGLSLKLTPSLASLFKPNDFFWKKAVMGCAISHLKLWTMLQGDSEEIKTYLILEDDARLKAGWKDSWLKVYSSLPAGWECIYLGGVLPPNKEGFELVKEPVIPGLCRIRPNTFFGQSEPVRQFHFCTYAYILSRVGAKKLLDEIIRHNGIWTSADHVLFNSLDKMNVYCLDPLVAGASQDDDPAYINSDFNDFSRKDKFDSDLWNNDERFSIEEVSACLPLPLKIAEPLQEIYQPGLRQAQPRFISLDICKLTDSSIYEGKWLQELFGTTKFTLEPVSEETVFSQQDNLVVFLQRPMWNEQLSWLANLSRTNTFKIIHCSDEFSQDPCHFYSWPSVKGILRFYSRDTKSGALNIPLGYHWQNTQAVTPVERKYNWSFVGTNWKNRSRNLEALQAIENHYAKFFPDWNDPGQLKDDAYISLLHNSIFVPCPEGNNVETYRFYEALECGCIPVFTKLPAILLDSKIPFLKTETWEQVAELMKHLLKNPVELNEYRNTILSAWTAYKAKLKVYVEKWILL